MMSHFIFSLSLLPEALSFFRKALLSLSLSRSRPLSCVIFLTRVPNNKPCCCSSVCCAHFCPLSRPCFVRSFVILCFFLLKDGCSLLQALPFCLAFSPSQCTSPSPKRRNLPSRSAVSAFACVLSPLFFAQSVSSFGGLLQPKNVTHLATSQMMMMMISNYAERGDGGLHSVMSLSRTLDASPKEAGKEVYTQYNGEGEGEISKEMHTKFPFLSSRSHPQSGILLLAPGED